MPLKAKSLKGVVFLLNLKAIVQTSNEYIKVKSSYLKSADYESFIDKISNASYWDSTETLKMLLSAVPNYHLSQFHPYLPEKLQLKLTADTIYDLEGTLELLRNLSV